MPYIKKHAIRNLQSPDAAQDIDDNFDAIFATLRALQNQIGAIDASVGADGAEGKTIVGPMGEDGEDGPPGPPGVAGVAGATGSQGPAGPPTIGPMGIDGSDGDDGLPIPGPRGETGATGATGPTGPPFPSFIIMDGADGDDGYPLPGRDGTGELSAWKGKIVACAGDGNPNAVISQIQTGMVAPTPTNITISQGRVSYFKLDQPISVATIRWYGINATTDIYHIAIYRASDNARMSADNTVSTTANTWNSVANSFSLAANTLYYAVVSVDTTGAVAGIAAIGETISATLGQIRVLPTDWPGNLDWDANFVVSYAFAVVAVTSGVLPDPGNAPTAFSANLTGGMPAIFLDSV